eukprot:7211052-Prymnesium_polylepis.1
MKQGACDNGKDPTDAHTPIEADAADVCAGPGGEQSSLWLALLRAHLPPLPLPSSPRHPLRPLTGLALAHVVEDRRHRLPRASVLTLEHLGGC